MWIRLHVDAGDDLDSAIKQALAMARHLNVNVEFKFNGTPCTVRPNDAAEYIVRRYHCDAVQKRKVNREVNPQP